MLINKQNGFLATTAMLTMLLTSVVCTNRSLALQAHDHSAHDHGPDEHANHDHAAETATRGAHGGQIATSGEFVFETFFAPQETRLYVFDSNRQPVSARELRGELVMLVRGNEQEYRFPLGVGQAQGEDFLGAQIDVSGIQDGDMQVTFEIQGLPSRSQPSAKFAQVFALSRQPLTVAVAQLTEDDRPGITRQQTCPVMNTRLGEHGAPIKLVVGGQPLYVCCKGCIAKVQSNPAAYLQMVGLSPVAAQNPVANQTQISASYATTADDAAIRAQGRCVVMTDQQLGGHGNPIKIMVGDQSLFVCCKGCVQKVQENPDLYLAKARELSVRR